MAAAIRDEGGDMSHIIEGVTIETFPDAVKHGHIQPGQRFSILIEEKSLSGVPSLVEIAARMRATAEARGMTTEIFDRIIADKK
jgi:hypothetical protein